MSKSTLATIVLLLLSWLSLPAYAGVCDLPSGDGIGGTGAPIYNSGSGIGGTGHTLDPNGSGIGGTGKTAINGNGSGIGGTGKTAQTNNNGSGIGGTGLPVQDADIRQLKTGLVSGTITGFGSICVNGIEIHYANSTPLSVDGQQAEISSLAVGQVVTASIQGTGNEVYANEIHVMHAASGPIDFIDPNTGEMSVLGQQVVVSHAQQLQQFAVGDKVNISGLHHPDGFITASRVEAAADLDKVSLHGPVHLAANNQFAIGSMPLVGNIPASIQAGQHIMVSGALQPNAIKVQQVVDLQQLTPVSEPGGMVSVEALINSHADLEKFAGNALQLSEQMQNELDTLDDTRKVIVTGQLDNNDVIEVSHIRIEQIDTELESVIQPDVSNKSRENEHRHEAESHEQHEKSDTDDREFEKQEYEQSEAHEAKEHEYEKPETHEVEDHEYEKPETPEVEEHEYEAPETPEYEAPETPEVEVPEYEAPETPEVEVPEYEAPETPEVEVPEYEAPETPEVEVPEYEAPETPEVEVPEYEAPEVPEVEVPEYEAPETPEIEVPEYEAPETPEVEVPEYEAPEVPEIEVPEVEEPEYEAPELPEYEGPEG